MVFSKKNIHLTSIITSLLVMLSGVLSVCIISEKIISFQVMIGVFLAIAAALGAALVAWNSEKAELLSLSPIIVLAWRFHLTWFLSLVIYAFIPVEKITSSDIFNPLWLVLVGVILPMYFMQKGMQKSSPLIIMMCLSMLPLNTYIFEVTFGSRVNFYLLGVLLIGVGASFFQIWIDKRLESKLA